MGKHGFMPLGAALTIAAIPFVVALAGKALASPTIAGFSYTETVVRDCSSSTKSCSAKFSTIPSPGTPVRMHSLSCAWSSSTALRRVALAIDKGLTVVGFRYVGSNEFDQVSGVLNVPLYNTEGVMTFPVGTVPEVIFTLSSSGTITFTCTISGLTG
jgi:hypothetical protein